MRKRISCIIALALLCLMLCTACSSTINGDIFSALRQGDAVEAFDAQAIPAMEAGLAEYWYPQHLITAVIAVDRDQTDAPIAGWRDLLPAGAVVGFCDKNLDGHMLMAAIAYGLEGKDFTLRGAANLLAQLQAENRLIRNSFEPPIVICYDSQAAELIESGRNIEIIAPQEGTLTYEKGLLSNHPLEIELGTPHTAPYVTAARVTDYAHFNAAMQDATRILRRTVQRVRLYSSADGREHQFLALLFMVLVVVWTAGIVRRTMQKGVRRAVLATGILLLGWIIVRLFKYQIFIQELTVWLWYSFYLFLLALPLVLLWLAWAIDQPDDHTMPPKWLAAPAAVNGALAVLVFTNNLHNWVLQLDYSNPNWSVEYGYGWGYYAVLADCVALALAALAMLLIKSRKSPRKNRVVFPLALCVLLAAYGAGYLLRIPLAWESDYTMMLGLFTLLFVEACVRTGLIPLNTKYMQLFTHSPLAMQIMDHRGKTVLSSAQTLRQDENTLQFTAPISGGHAVWQEDIGALNRLHRDVEESVRKLEFANAVLAGEEGIRRAMEDENARTQLMSQLEAEITRHTAQLSDMIERGESTARIALLLCYIKRRCNLFFHAHEAGTLSADDLAMYIDELAEFAGYAAVQIISACQIKDPVHLRSATLFYDFFYSVIHWASTGIRDLKAGGRVMLAHLVRENGRITLRLLPSGDARTYRPARHLADAIASAGGTWAIKDLDDAAGISLSFPEDTEGGSGV